jgi:hypothetical protein
MFTKKAWRRISWTLPVSLVMVMNLFIPGVALAAPNSQEQTPFVMAWPEDDRVEGSHFIKDAIVTLTVTDSETGVSYEYSAPATIPEWDLNRTWVDFEMGFDLNEGDTLEITDGVTTYSHTMTALTVDPHLNAVDNTASGTAAAGSTVHLRIHEPNGSEMDVIADTDGDYGDWIADYDDAPIPKDLVAGTGITITQQDEVGDPVMTTIERFLPVPHIKASLTDDWYAVHGCSPNEPISFAVYDDGGVLLPGYPIHPTTNAYGHWGVDVSGIDLVPGMRITLTDVATGLFKELILADGLSVDGFDADLDRVWGTAPTAPEGSLLTVVAWNSETDSHEIQFETGGGAWVADFAGLFDIASYAVPEARLDDGDGDETVVRYVSPTADPNGPYIVYRGNGVTLDGSGSTDPSGCGLTYEWDIYRYWGDFESSPYVWDDLFDDGAGEFLTLDAESIDESGIYHVRLRVTDLCGGESDPAETTIEVYDPHVIAIPQDDHITGLNWREAVDIDLHVDGIHIDTQTAQFLSEKDLYGVEFRLGDYDPPIDLQPGMLVELTASNGDYAGHVVRNHTLDVVDEVNNVVEGTADPGTTVSVRIMEPDWVEVFATADGSGIWSFDFDVLDPPFDITPDMFISVIQQDDTDSDHTVVYVGDEPGDGPFITVQPDHRWVQGHNWPADVDITLIIDLDDDPDNGVEYQVTQGFGEGEVWFGLGELEWLAPGYFVSMSDGTTTKTIWIEELYFEAIDEAMDTATGRCPGCPNETLVGVGIETEMGGYWMEALVIDGTWTADFSAEDPDFSVILDANVVVWDADGDETMAHLNLEQPPEPYFTIQPDHRWADGYGWPEGTQVTITIYASADPGAQVVHSDTVPSGPAPWDPNEIVAVFNFDEVEVLRGYYVTMSGGGVTKETTIADLYFDAIDPGDEIASGRGPADGWVGVWINSEGMEFFREVQVDGEGDWVADFSGESINYGNIEDARVVFWDEDGDETMAHLEFEQPLEPFFTIQPDQRWAFGALWPVGVEVTLVIDDNDDPGDGVIHQETLMTEPAEWDQEVGVVEFQFGHVEDVQRGYFVSMSDGEITKTTWIAELYFDALDVNTGIATGQGPADNKVGVLIQTEFEKYWMDVPVDASGNWTADFSSQNPDFSAIEDAFVILWDDDGDETMAHLPPPEFVDGSLSPNPMMMGEDVTISAEFLGSTQIVDMSYRLFGYTDWLPMTLDGGFPVAVGTVAHLFETTGVYAIGVRATDTVGLETTEFLGYLAVYDPEGGFVTGGGWIWSPQGALPDDPSLEGKATFGFVAKYRRGANVPTGQTQFQFRVADLSFHSTSYDWLVVAGKKAIFKGVGTINGEGEYRFMISAWDGDLQGGDGIDKFRIRIWVEDAYGNEIVVYDNQIGDWPEADPSTELGGGSIVIHVR